MAEVYAVFAHSGVYSVVAYVLVVYSGFAAFAPSIFTSYYLMPHSTVSA